MIPVKPTPRTLREAFGDDSYLQTPAERILDRCLYAITVIAGVTAAIALYMA